MMGYRSVIVFDGETILSQHERDVSWNEMRSRRDLLLKDSDWRAGKDVVLSTAWKDYRQALRDLPQDYDSANDAADSFPVMPDA